MIETFLGSGMAQLGDWVGGLDTLALIRQAAAILLALLLAPVIGRALRAVVDRAQASLDRVSRLRSLAWPGQIFDILRAPLRPLAAWLLGQAALALFQSLGWPSVLLAWIVPLLLVWFFYRLIATLLDVRLPVERAATYRRSLLRPAAVLLVLLHAVSLLDNVMDFTVRLGEGISLTVGAVILGLIVLALFLVLARFMRQLLAGTLLPEVGVEPALNQVISTFAAYALILFGVFTALGIAGVDLTALGFIAAGLTVGLGFGLQEVISNFVSGFILLLERSISPGDVIKMGDYVGMVDSITVRSTRVRTNDNVELIVPNSKFLTDVAVNYTRGDPRVRLTVAVGVSYDADPREVEEALLEAARLPLVLSDPSPSVQFSDFGASSLDFKLLVWTDQSLSIPKLSSDLRYSIWNALSARSIQIPFPQRDIHIRSAIPAATDTS